MNQKEFDEIVEKNQSPEFKERRRKAFKVSMISFAISLICSFTILYGIRFNFFQSEQSQQLSVLLLLLSVGLMVYSVLIALVLKLQSCYINRLAQEKLDTIVK